MMTLEQVFDAGAVSLNYVAEGPETGPPMVFLHGVTANWQGWLPVMTAFAAQWRVYALDLRGHGRSSWVPGGYRAVDYVPDVVAFLRGRVERPAVLVGASLGAMVAIAVAATTPEAVRGVTLLDPPLGWFDSGQGRPSGGLASRLAMRDLVAARLPREQLFAALAERMPRFDAAALGARTLWYSQLDADVLAVLAEDRLSEGYDLEGLLRSVACPALVLQGNVDLGGLLDDVQIAKARALLADCTVEQLRTTGHLILFEQPFELCRRLRAFAGRL